MSTTYRNLHETRHFKLLKEQRIPSLRELLSPERIKGASVPMAAGLTYHYSAIPVDHTQLGLLQGLADEMEVTSSYQQLLDGEIMNTGESRMVLHHLTRGQLGKDIYEDGVLKKEFYQQQLSRIQDFARKVHNGTICGSTGKPFDTVVQIGIGGSDLGPRALYLSLRGYAASEGRTPAMRAQFISNVDPDDAAQVLEDIDCEKTLFILVSKSGTTQETLTNRELVFHHIEQAHIPGLDPAAHMVAVTSRTSPLAQDSRVLDAFYIDDYIGGRYSSTSAVGTLVLSLAYGAELVLDILAGAHEADALALEQDITKNAALLDALIGVYLRSVRGYPTTAVLPYSQALSRFAAHLQQLDMESNGKSVNRFGETVPYPTGPVIFGEPGTNGQHSFYQLLHQGTDIIPLQFIGFRQSQYRRDLKTDGSTSQQKLQANLAAQITAFALGRSSEQPNKHFPGERPSSLIIGQQLTPRSLGALLAHFENKVMFQGFLWNLNSFDQEGVQLGKVLSQQLLEGSSPDPVLKAFYDLLV